MGLHVADNGRSGNRLIAIGALPNFFRFAVDFPTVVACGAFALLTKNIIRNIAQFSLALSVNELLFVNAQAVTKKLGFFHAAHTERANTEFGFFLATVTMFTILGYSVFAFLTVPLQLH